MIPEHASITLMSFFFFILEINLKSYQKLNMGLLAIKTQ